METTIHPAAQALIDAAVAFRLNENTETADAVSAIEMDTLPNPMPGGWERAAMDVRLDAHALLAGPNEAGSWAFLASRRPQPGDEVIWVWPMEPIMMGLKGRVTELMDDGLMVVHWNGAEEPSPGVKHWMVAVTKRATQPTEPSNPESGVAGDAEATSMSEKDKDDGGNDIHKVTVPKVKKAEASGMRPADSIDPRVPDSFHGNTQDFVDGYVARLDWKGEGAKAHGEKAKKSPDWKAGWHKANKVSFGGE